jgi:hypothetical protein
MNAFARRRRAVSTILAVFLAAFLAAAPAQAAIINSLRGFDRDERGWSGSLTGSYGAAGGNTRESTFAGSGQVQWNDLTQTAKLIAAAKRTTSRGEETARAILGHLRHNYRLGPRWATVTFLQAQQNPFQRLDSRYLAGLGARYDLVDSDRVLWSLGGTHMWESQRIQDETGHRDAQRLSAFTSLEAKLGEGVVLDFLTFYQPKWSDFGDWRLFGQVLLEVELNGTLSLFTGYQIEHNERPPAGVEMTDWETTTGFKAAF